MYKVIPLNKTGTLYQRPSWRFHSIQNPGVYDLMDYVTSKKSKFGGYLKRLITRGLDTRVNYIWPEIYSDLTRHLPDHLQLQLQKVWGKHFFSQQDKLSYLDEKQCHDVASWNVRRVQQLNDVWLKKLILHVFNFEYDRHVAFALNMHLQDSNKEIKRFIGFCIFAGLSDKEIAVRWKIGSHKSVEALRNLLFDFSNMSNDKVAVWAQLRQLVHMGDISEEDFGFYKRIYDLGKLGLEAQVAFLHLTDEDKQKVEKYLCESAAINTYKIDFSIKNSKDAIAYNKIISDLSRTQLQHAMIRKSTAEAELIKLNSKKLSKEMNMEVEQDNTNDNTLFQEALKNMSKYDAEPKYIDYADLEK